MQQFLNTYSSSLPQPRVAEGSFMCWHIINDVERFNKDNNKCSMLII